MTRTYAAKRLLEHGPLTLREFTEITGWGRIVSWNTLYQLMNEGIVMPCGRKQKTRYALAK